MMMMMMMINVGEIMASKSVLILQLPSGSVYGVELD